MKIKNQKGFTLIELLVVVAIISLLSSVVMAALNDARARARDARRIEDLRQINNAIQLYIQDHGEAPEVDGGTHVSYSSHQNGGDWDNLADMLRPYIKKMPVDPLNDTPIPNAIKVNTTYSNAFGYVYRRIENHSDYCPGHPTCSDKTLYILDVQFEKREPTRLPGAGAVVPISMGLFGVNYPQW
ncbi:MAG: ral secretion pathway protein [Candidatus Parcubacteria bacterium]|jgi:prepilin-type N-terminal cleavage/methylation domain-containing protein